jgi:hypothetical protein
MGRRCCPIGGRVIGIEEKGGSGLLRLTRGSGSGCLRRRRRVALGGSKSGWGRVVEELYLWWWRCWCQRMDASVVWGVEVGFEVVVVAESVEKDDDAMRKQDEGTDTRWMWTIAERKKMTRTEERR